MAISYRASQFVFEAQERLDELAYGAHMVAGLSGLSSGEEKFFENLSREFNVMNDSMMERFHMMGLRRSNGQHAK